MTDSIDTSEMTVSYCRAVIDKHFTGYDHEVAEEVLRILANARVLMSDVAMLVRAEESEHSQSVLPLVIGEAMRRGIAESDSSIDAIQRACEITMDIVAGQFGLAVTADTGKVFNVANGSVLRDPEVN